MYFLRKVVALIVVAVMVFVTAVPGSTEASSGGQNGSSELTAMYNKIMDAEAEWLVSLPFESGAIPTYSDPISNYGGKYKIIPYFTHIALLGLLEKPEYADVVKNYMDWYFAHLNMGAGPNAPDGSVYDYIVETDRVTETPTNDFDSTDSYASTFLNLLRKYAEVTGDAAYVADHKKEILLIASAMLATQEEDGLTWAKPTYKVKYLMDNTEVYKGLVDMEWIAEHIFEDTVETLKYKVIKEQVQAGIQSELWLEHKQMYSPGKMESGSLLNSEWNTFYADATAQIFPIWTGVIAKDSERALQLYNSFNEHHPGWPTLDKSDAFPWAMIAYTAALMGDKVRVDQFLQSIEAAYVDEQHPWPWYVMESGLTMLATAKMLELEQEPRQFDMTSLQDSDVIEEASFEMSGVASGLDQIEVIFTHQLSGRSTVFHASPEAGAWSVELQGLTNGNYRVEVNAKDKFNNIHFTRSLTVAVMLGAAGEGMAQVTIQADREMLRRNESTSIIIEAFNEDGERIDLSDAQIVYHTDKPELLVAEGENRFVLRGLPLDQSVDRVKLWAFVTKGNDVLKTEELTILISREAATEQDELLDLMANWLADRQLDTGALTLDEQDNYIDPVASNIAALGLLLRPETVELAERYITDYFGSWNWGDRFGVYGTKYEYELDEPSEAWVSTADYRSAAANIATFITLQRSYYERTGELIINQYQLDVITGGLGLMSLQAADGLMWQKKNGQTKLLLDNLLALQGMKDSVWLFRNYFESEDPVAYFDGYAEMLRTGIEEKLWDEEAGQYALSIDAADEQVAAEWAEWEDAALQLTAIAARAIAPDSVEAAALYTDLNESFPNWAIEKELSGLHGIVAYVAALMGDEERATAGLARMTEALKSGNLPVDWNVASAGYAMLAAQAVKELLKPDKSGLEVLIAEARQLHDQAQEGSSVGQYPAGSKYGFYNAIVAAQAVLLNELVDQETVDAAVSALEQASETFRKSIHIYIPTSSPAIADKAGLNQAIANAQAKHDAAVEGDKPGQYRHGAKQALQAAINVAAEVQRLAGAMHQQVNDAIARLNDAVAEFVKQAVTGDGGEGGDDGSTGGNGNGGDGSSGSSDFRDMKGHWSDSIVGRAVELGVVEGYPDGTFRPDQQVTREQFVTMLARALQLPVNSSETNEVDFSDNVQISAWAQPYVAAVVKAKLIQGFEDGAFRPQQTVTRVQLAVLAARAAGLVTVGLEDVSTTALVAGDLQAQFADADQIPAWAKAKIGAAAKAGFVQGKGAGRFDPVAAATRAEAAKVIMAVLDYMKL